MEKQKFISKKWFILLLIVLLLIPVVAYAAPTGLSQAAGIFQDLFKGMAAFLTTTYRLLQKILWPLMLAIGGLLGNDLLFGAGMEERLLDVWFQIRNFVNIGFVLVLLIVALMNVLGAGKENFELKTVLPRIVIALILVNFSYMGMKLILDATNVLTIAIFSLPTSISEDLKSTEIVTKKVDANGKLVINATTKKQEYTQSTSQKELESKICKSMFGTTDIFDKATEPIKGDARKSLRCENIGGKLVFTEAGKEFFATYSPRNASLILAIQMMNIVDIDKVTQAAADKFDLQKMSFTLLFSTVFYLLYAIAYVVLFVVLLARLIVLWVIIALSPVIALAMAMPDLFKGISSSNFDIKEKFINHAIVPIKIAIPMTIGYMMLDALKNVDTGAIANFVQFKSFDINTSGISDLQTMIVAFGAVGVVWVGVFSAADGTIAEGAVGWIKGQLQNAGRQLTSTLKVLPLIPSKPGQPGRSIDSTVDALRQPLNQLRAKHGQALIPPSTSNRPTLTEHQANQVRTVIQAKQALGKNLSNKRAQMALARKFQDWSTGSQGADKKRFAKRVQQKAGTRGWRDFTRKGTLTGTPLANVQALGTSPATLAPAPARTPSGPATTKPSKGAAATTAITAAGGYGSRHGIMSDRLTKQIEAYKQTKAGSQKQKNAARDLQKDEEYKNVQLAQQKNSGSMNAMQTAGSKMEPLAEGVISQPQRNNLRAAVETADKDLTEAGVKDQAARQKMIQGKLKQIFGAKLGTHIKDQKTKKLAGL